MTDRMNVNVRRNYDRAPDYVPPALAPTVIHRYEQDDRGNVYVDGRVAGTVPACLVHDWGTDGRCRRCGRPA